MSSVRLDNVLISSDFPGLSRVNVVDTSLVVSGSIPDGGKDFTTPVIPIPDGSMVVSYYSVTGSSLATPDELFTVTGSSHGSAIDGGPNINTVDELASNSSWIGIVRMGNFSGSPFTAPTQTVNFRVYIFTSPFN